MKTLTIEQLESNIAGNVWRDAATYGCAAWAVGKFFAGIAISCAASPFAGVLITAAIDSACLVVAADRAAELYVKYSE